MVISKRKIYSLILLWMTSLLFFFSNCAQQGAIELSQKAANVAGQEVIQEIISNCNLAERNGQLQTMNQTIVFDDTRTESGRAEICEFPESGLSANGNLPTSNNYMQSRYEQNRKLNLPANAVLCDLEVTNDLQSFRYDDVFFFNFNGFLLASNNKTAVQNRWTPTRTSLGNNQSAGVYTYDWSQIRSAQFENVADDYCLGAAEGLASCSWPVSEKQGRIQFSFDRSILIALSANTQAVDQRFSFAITGDNDKDIDCYHERLEFRMKAKYYLK